MVGPVGSGAVPYIHVCVSLHCELGSIYDDLLLEADCNARAGVHRDIQELWQGEDVHA